MFQFMVDFLLVSLIAWALYVGFFWVKGKFKSTDAEVKKNGNS